MRKLILAVLFLIACNGAAPAQSTGDRSGWGYAFGGIGAIADEGSAALFHIGVGGEVVVFKGLAVGPEIGYIAPFEAGGDGIGLFSANGSYHFGVEDASRKLVPFVTGGYSLGFRSGVAHGGNFGGGIQYWAGERVGIRAEFRDHILSSEGPHLLSFRFGVSFR